MEKGNSIINAVKRLERAGSEHSRATQKLYEAAREVASLIEAQVPAGVKLPRGYYVKEICSNVGCADFLCIKIPLEYAGTQHYEETRYIDGIGRYLHGDFHCWVPGQDRATVLKFAEDIADGLLDEIAEWLEARAAKAEQAAEVLENAK